MLLTQDNDKANIILQNRIIKIAPLMDSGTFQMDHGNPLTLGITIVIFLGCKTGRKEMFYLTTHLTHFIQGYMGSRINYGKAPLKYRERKPAAATWATLSD